MTRLALEPLASWPYIDATPVRTPFKSTWSSTRDLLAYETEQPGWKLGPHARALTAEAHRHGVWVHMGRVNSHRRLRYARDIGCDSADGTFLAFGPDRNLPQLLAWLAELDRQPALWDSEATA